MLLWYQKPKIGGLPWNSSFQDLKWGLCLQSFVILKSFKDARRICVIWGSFSLGQSLGSSYQVFMAPGKVSSIYILGKWLMSQGATKIISNLCWQQSGSPRGGTGALSGAWEMVSPYLLEFLPGMIHWLKRALTCDTFAVGNCSATKLYTFQCIHKHSFSSHICGWLGGCLIWLSLLLHLQVSWTPLTLARPNWGNSALQVCHLH